tara:strand:+ start:513 stop:689 length:177 start_codon:yes stop_codon:yes gene_type:complete
MKYIREIFILSWTLAGSAYILITLPFGSQVFKMAAAVTVAAFTMHMIGLALDREDEDD